MYHPDFRKGNIRIEKNIEKLKDMNRSLLKKIDEKLKDYPEELKKIIHEEFFLGPFSNEYYKPDMKKIFNQ